jgi:hypothetical protein
LQILLAELLLPVNDELFELLVCVQTTGGVQGRIPQPAVLVRDVSAE